MIKNSTLAKTAAKKDLLKTLPLENKRLNKELQKSCVLIDQARGMIEGQRKEIEKLKSHWTYKIANFFKW